MNTNQIKNVVIVGGGTAGWMTAAALVKHLGPKACSITLVESDQIGTVGVGEATIPVIRQFNQLLELDEVEFMQKTNATFKLGILFENWGNQGDGYIHPFGTYGSPLDLVGFHHFWNRLRQSGDSTSFFDFNLHHVTGEMGRMNIDPGTEQDPMPALHYAFHFDATLYAGFLREWSKERGVIRTEGKVTEIAQNPDTGDIQSITLESGDVIEGELFIDCTGFRGLLIEQQLETGFEDWSHWLPVNRAWAASSTYPEHDQNVPPYTRARALDAGWQWRIPLQNRTGDGHVFCNSYQDEQAALDMFLDEIEGDAMNEPRLLKFETGLRKNLWTKNCVSIGLSAGFLEPLESTSIALIQATIMSLLNFFPVDQIEAADRDEFNTVMRAKYEEARDFLIMHYNVTEREDTEFWRYCKNMSIPEELSRRVELFRNRGQVAFSAFELFGEHSWLSVLVGQGILPETHDPRADGFDLQRLKPFMQSVRQDIRAVVEKMPTHNEVLASYCKGQLIGQSDQGEAS